MLSSLNFYYAKPGNENAVLRQRLHACDVRLELGIPRGRVYARTQGCSDLPDVVWEQVFEDISGHHADMAVRAASPAFEEVRVGMRKLCRRFERPLFQILEGEQAVAADGMPAVVSWDWFFCAADRTDAALAIVQNTAKRIGHPSPMSRLLRLISEANDLPTLLWQREYSEGAPVGAAQAELMAECAAAGVRVEPSLWRIATPECAAS